MGIIRYIDAAQAFKAVQRNPNAWIMPVFRRWFALGIGVTVALMLWGAR